MHLEDNFKKKTLQKHYSGLYKLQIVKVANLLMSPDCLIRAGWCTVGIQVYNCHVWLNESLDPAADSDEVQLYLQKTITEIDPHREKKPKSTRVADGGNRIKRTWTQKYHEWQKLLVQTKISRRKILTGAEKKQNTETSEQEARQVLRKALQPAEDMQVNHVAQRSARQWLK